MLGEQALIFLWPSITALAVAVYGSPVEIRGTIPSQDSHYAQCSVCAGSYCDHLADVYDVYKGLCHKLSNCRKIVKLRCERENFR